jgi:hypothetical protein
MQKMHAQVVLPEIGSAPLPYVVANSFCISSNVSPLVSG